MENTDSTVKSFVSVEDAPDSSFDFLQFSDLFRRFLVIAEFTKIPIMISLYCI